MKCIFVDPEFAALVDGYCAQYVPHLRLGARIVDNGANAGKGLVSTDIINSTPEWSQMFARFVVNSPTFKPGTDVVLRDIYGDKWTYTVQEIAEPSKLFKTVSL